MKTSCSFIAYKHRHRTVLFFIFKFRHVASFWKFGEGGGGNLVQKLWRAKRKKEKREFRTLEKWRRRDSTIIEFYMCKIQINVCTKKKESGETGPHHPSPCRDATCLKSTIFKKIICEAWKQVPQYSWSESLQLNYMYVTVDDECYKEETVISGWGAN